MRTLLFAATLALAGCVATGSSTFLVGAEHPSIGDIYGAHYMAVFTGPGDYRLEATVRADGTLTNVESTLYDGDDPTYATVARSMDGHRFNLGEPHMQDVLGDAGVPAALSALPIRELAKPFDHGHGVLMRVSSTCSGSHEWFLNATGLQAKPSACSGLGWQITMQALRNDQRVADPAGSIAVV